MTQAPLPTLHQHLSRDGGPAPALAGVIEAIAAACCAIAYEVRTAGIAGTYGAAGEVNVQGEAQKKLDVIADDIFAETCAAAPGLAALVSEEREDVNWLKTPEAGDFLLYYDPLDGSSNIDVNLSVGTIFSIAPVHAEAPDNPLSAGTRQVCAGYAIYGPATMLVLTTGAGVDVFTLDPARGDFLLTAAQIRVPAETSEFAINASRHRHWEPPVRAYIEDCLAGATGARGRNFNMRWAASMVADVHRILTRGGVFLYPIDTENRAKGGKLRLLYEAFPMAMLVEQAGGKASTGRARLLDVAPEGHHQRVSVILGSADEIDVIDGYHARAGG